MSGVMANEVVQRLAVRVNLSCLNRFTELRFVAPNRLELLLESVADVDDEGWLLMVFAEGQGVKNLERAVRRNFGLDLLQAGDETCIPHELRDDRMIRVSSVQRVSDDDLRLQASYHHGHLRPCFGGVLDSAIRESKILSYSDTHQFRRFRGFLRAQIRCPATGHFSGGEVEDSGGPAKHVRAD